MNEIVFTSALGNIRIVEEDGFITVISFTDQDEIDSASTILVEAKKELVEYFSGERKVFNMPLSPVGTDFQKTVWEELQEIPFGKTISYQELANRLGDPKSIRAAGTANGKNPIAIVIPCHRVIGSDGSMTGYASGIDKKRALLKIEGAAVMSQIDIF